MISKANFFHLKIKNLIHTKFLRKNQNAITTPLLVFLFIAYEMQSEVSTLEGQLD